ncbi:MAG: sporulation integral membrane protein YtvI [Halanaerobiales bacterium]|nr:sporulation integral membrane protein YtvI [Halanaerobiales bacterium]
MRIEFKILAILVGIILGFFLLKYSVAYFLPFLLAFIVAMLIEPIVLFLKKRLHLSRGWAVILVLALIILIFVIFLVLGVSRIYVELEKLSGSFSTDINILDQFQWILERNGDLMSLMERWHFSPEQQATVNQLLQDLYTSLAVNARSMITQLLGLLAKLPNLVTIFMITFIATFFISRDRGMFANIFWKSIPKRWEKKIRSVKTEITGATIGFIRAELILISITTIISIIGLEILNNDYALLIGFASGLLDLIPVIGPTLIFIPWAIYCMITGNFAYGIGLLIIYGVMAVVRQTAEVKIIGKSIGVHPLATLVAMYVGVKVFGVSGFFIGPAVVIVVKSLIKAGIITFIATKKG